MSKATAPDVDEVLVANVNGKYLRFKSLSSIPHGSKVYSAAEDLSGQTREQLQKLGSYLSGSEVAYSSHEEAVRSVWAAFLEVPKFDPAIHAPKVDDPLDDKKKKGSGKGAAKGKTYVKKRESTKYVMKPETDKSKAAIAKLAPQAKACVVILRALNITEISEPDLKKIFEEQKPDLRTKQDAWRIFQYYRSSLIKADVLIMQ